MVFAWLKTLMPRSLYGRAALILLLPVVTLQLGITILFVQDHFEEVTEQMTNSVLYDLQFVLDAVEAADDLEQAKAVASRIAAPLGFDMQLPAPQTPPEDTRVWYDFSEGVVIAKLHDALPKLSLVTLIENSDVIARFETAYGPLSLAFSRARVSASNPHQLLVWLVVLGLVMTLIAFIYLRNQLRPIKRLARAATDYGKGRIKTYHPAGATEVRAAGTAFLDMRNRIERQNQTRTMMLSGVSHDLRTPLTRLRLGLGLIDEDETALLIKDVDEMERLLDAFLDFARGDAEDVLDHVDPADLVRAVLADQQRMGRNVSLGEVDSEGKVQLRAMAVRRSLDNLIGNALRYGSQARVSLHVSPRALRFTVEDDGPGIPADQREEAVRPFTRLDPARNQDRGSGVGLGLAIVADIARAHGGSLRLGESADLGGLQVDFVLAR